MLREDGSGGRRLALLEPAGGGLTSDVATKVRAAFDGLEADAHGAVSVYDVDVAVRALHSGMGQFLDGGADAALREDVGKYLRRIEEKLQARIANPQRRTLSWEEFRGLW